MIYDMTKGSPLKMILSFSAPMLIGNIFQQIYNFVDAAVVGKFVGAQSLAAVGATSTLMTLAICFMMGMTNGAGIIISQCFGKRDYVKLRETVASLVYIIAVMAVVTSAAGVCLARRILLILNTPSDVIDESVRYISIIFAFMVTTAAYNASGAVLRSLGDSRTPLFALIISAMLNVGMDLLFVVVFRMGVAGAAWATVIAQMISAVFCIMHIVRHRKILNLDGIIWKAKKETVFKIFRTGLPASLESCLISLGTMSVQRLVNSFGSMTMAAYTAATRIDSIAIMPVVSVGMSLSVFTGQNMGADNIDRIKTGLYRTLAALIGICVVIAAAIVTFRVQLLGMFLDDTAAEAVKIGGEYLTIVSTAYLVAAVMRSYLNVLRGAGDVNTSAVSGITELGARILFAYILVKFFGATGIWIATPLAWAAGAAIPVARYYSGKWQEKKLV